VEQAFKGRDDQDGGFPGIAPGGIAPGGIAPGGIAPGGIGPGPGGFAAAFFKPSASSDR
jgi:hypothetical protein